MGYKSGLLLILVIILFPNLVYSGKLLLLSPSLEVYNLSTHSDNLTLSLDYFNTLNTKKLFLQIDNSIKEIRQKNFINIYNNPKFTQEGVLHLPTRINNWIKYDFSLYLNDKKKFSIEFKNSESDDKYVLLNYFNSTAYKGWYCYNDNGLKKIPLKDTLYYNLTIILKSNGLYYNSYEILENNKFIADCNIPNNKLKHVDLIKIENKNNDKIITKSSLYVGTYQITLDPGYHKIILFAYLQNKSLYNVSKEFFVVLDNCGNLKCEGKDDCSYDCNNENKVSKGLSIPNWINQDNLILSIETTNRLINENDHVYLVFDLSKNQYDTKININNIELDDFYVEDYFFVRKYLNYSDLFTYELDNTIIKDDLIPLKHNHKYTLYVHLLNLSVFKIGENYGIFDFSGITSVYYKVIMPRDLFSQIHLPKDNGVPTFTNRLINALKEHKIKLLIIILILMSIYIFILYHKKKIRRTTMRIKEKYGIEIN